MSCIDEIENVLTSVNLALRKETYHLIERTWICSDYPESFSDDITEVVPRALHSADIDILHNDLD